MAHDDSHPPAAERFPFPAAVVAAGEGRTLDVLGETLIVKVAPADTAGAYAVVEEISPPGGGTPLHTHATEDEIIYVLEGRLAFQRGGDTFTAGPGATAVLPRGVPHAFRNVGSTPSRVLVFIAPGRLLGFFEELDARARSSEVTPADASRMGARYGLTIHPPPDRE